VAPAKPIKTRIKEEGAGVVGVVTGGPPGVPGGIAGGYVRVRLIIVTAPLIANNLPSIDTPALVVIEVKARIFPRKEVPVPNVAELPTCQKIFAA
jgi:hypothetical protein